MKVYVDAWIYVTEKFVNVGNIELYEEISRYEKADYPPMPNFMAYSPSFAAFSGQRAAPLFRAELPSGFAACAVGWFRA